MIVHTFGELISTYIPLRDRQIRGTTDIIITDSRGNGACYTEARLYVHFRMSQQ